MKVPLALMLCAVAAPALAQADPHAGHAMQMPMDMPMEGPADPHAGHRMPMPQPAPAVSPQGARGTDQAPGTALPQLKRRASKSEYSDEDVAAWTPDLLDEAAGEWTPETIGQWSKSDRILRKKAREARRLAQDRGAVDPLD